MLDVAQGVLGDNLEEDAPLMESGLDSLSAVDFRNQAGRSWVCEVVLLGGQVLGI